VNRCHERFASRVCALSRLVRVVPRGLFGSTRGWVRTYRSQPASHQRRNRLSVSEHVPGHERTDRLRKVPGPPDSRTRDSKPACVVSGSRASENDSLASISGLESRSVRYLTVPAVNVCGNERSSDSSDARSSKLSRPSGGRRPSGRTLRVWI